MIIPSFETKFLSTGWLVLLCTVTIWNAKSFTVEASNTDLKMQIISSPLQKYQSFPYYYKFISFHIIPKLTGSKNWIWLGFIAEEGNCTGQRIWSRGSREEDGGRTLWAGKAAHTAACSGLLGTGQASSKGPWVDALTPNTARAKQTSTEPSLLHHREALRSSSQSTNYLSLLAADQVMGQVCLTTTKDRQQSMKTSFPQQITKLLTCKTMSVGAGGLQIGMRDLSGMMEVS